MDIKCNSVVSITTIALIISLAIARGESKEMNQDCNTQQTSSSVQHKVNDQTEAVLNYWTPERMQNAKPLMPTISETPAKLHSDIESPTSEPISAPGSVPQSDI